MKNYLLCIFLAVFTISIYGQNHKNAADYRTDAINGNAIAQFISDRATLGDGV